MLSSVSNSSWSNVSRDILIEIIKHISLDELYKIIILNKSICGIMAENSIIWEYKYNILIKNESISSIQTEMIIKNYAKYIYRFQG